MCEIVCCLNDQLVFELIHLIFVQDLLPRFCLHLFDGIVDAHLSAYLLQSTQKHMLLTQNKFIDYYPLTAYEVGGCKYVVLKNPIFDDNECSMVSTDS
jgi:hypothetical protein